MPMPRFMAHINKRVFNPISLRRKTWPILTHIGRVSGTTYHTPLDGFPVDGGWILYVIYGPQTDWMRNVVAAGGAQLLVDGETIELRNPRLVKPEEADALAPVATKLPPRGIRPSFIRLDIAS